MSSNETANIYASEYSASSRPIPAEIIAYDNTDSGLTAENVQAAIDEIAGAVDDIVEMPALPAASADGTYVLKATAADGTITYAWVLEV